MTAVRGRLGRGLAALIPVAPDPIDGPEDESTSNQAALQLAPVLGRFAGPEDRLTPVGNDEIQLDRGGTTDQPDWRSEPVAATSSGRHVSAEPVDDALVMLPVTALVPNPRQPRAQFDDAAQQELVASVRQVGILQPIVVRPADEGLFEIVMGERRWRAAAAAGLAGIPAIIRPTPETEMLRDAMIENLQRAQLNPLEEANGYAELIADLGLTHDQIADKLGRSRSHVTNTLRLLTLPPAVQRRIAAGVLSAGHAKALLGMSDPAAVEALANRIVAEGLSVRSAEEIVAVDRPAVQRRPRKESRSGGRRDAFEPLARCLSEHFDTRVKVELGKMRGRIVVEFGSVDDLHRIIAAMAPEASERLLAGEPTATAAAT